MKLPAILFVDDQRSARDLFVRILEGEEYEAMVAGSVAEAEALMEQCAPDVVVTDLQMPEVDGLVGLERFLRRDPNLPVVLITAFGSVETAVEAMKRGAFDYLRKPFNPSELRIVIERALSHRRLIEENERLRSEVARGEGDATVIGRSPGIRAVLSLVTQVAPSDFTVLILGESGTGKDLIARAIHRGSHRSEKPFISINCSAIPEHLLESELFGHQKGAFSGAIASRAGFFQEADGGTLFLDEIGDMSQSLQPKLLRVLENGEFYPVGSRQLVQSNIRLVCASNQRIHDLVREQRFRQDLYYRINTVGIELPALRDRVEDIPLLVEHFLARLDPPPRISPDAMRRLLEYDWPGNVRELSHAIERAALVRDGDLVQRSDLPPDVLGHEPAQAAVRAPGYKDARAGFERSYFLHLLAETDGNIQHAAEIARLHRSTLYEKLSKLDIHIDRPAPRAKSAKDEEP